MWYTIYTMTKVCTKCGLEKDTNQFAVRKQSPDGCGAICKKCKADYDEKRRRNLGIPPKRTPFTREEKLERQRIAGRIYREENRQDVNFRARTKNKLRRKTDPDFAIKTQLTNRLGDAIRNGQKAGSGLRDLGCSVAELRIHLEAKFRPGMTWENRGHGFGKWNIDHIIPLAAFNLTNRQHVLLVCNYLNLQPLWHEENMSKGDKLDFQLR